MMRWLFFTFGILPSLPLWLLLFSLGERFGFSAKYWKDGYVFSIASMVSLSVAMTASIFALCFFDPHYLPIAILYSAYSIFLSYYIQFKSELGE